MSDYTPRLKARYADEIVKAMTEKFGRRFQDSSSPRFGFGVDFQVESYLRHQGESFLSRFDALSYLYLSRALDYYDPFSEPDAASQLAAMAEYGTRTLVLSFDSDWRFDTSHSLRIAQSLEHARVPVTFREVASPTGHDSFLLPVPEYHAVVAAFLGAGRAA